jgi:hypothetical protein
MSSTDRQPAAGVGEHHLARLAEQAYERRGDFRSLLYEGAWMNSGHTFERARRLGGGFASLGLKPGERVVATMANCPEVSIVNIRRCGAPAWSSLRRRSYCPRASCAM